MSAKGRVTSGRRGAQGGSPSGSSFAPLLAAVFLAAVLLAGMLFWSGQSDAPMPGGQPSPEAKRPAASKIHDKAGPPSKPQGKPEGDPSPTRPTAQQPQPSNSRPQAQPPSHPLSAPRSANSTGTPSMPAGGGASRSEASSARDASPLPRAEATADRPSSPRPVYQSGPGLEAGEALPPVHPSRDLPSKSDAVETAIKGKSAIPEPPPDGPAGERAVWKRPKAPPSDEEPAKDREVREARKESVKVALAPPGPADASHAPIAPPTHALPRLTPPLARVAIVIDDFGLDVEIAKKFAALPFPITFSILPHLPHSFETAEIARARGRQILLHMPMEPQGYPRVKPGPGALLLSMSEQAVLGTLRDALAVSPYAAGINNHMGSRFTEHSGLMKVVIQEVGHRGLFFLDSATSARSVAGQLAQELRVSHVRRDVFLDHTLTEKAVKAQLRQLIQKARLQGTAVAIGHPHEVTLRALQGAADQLKREGIEVASVGELAVR